MPDPLDIELLKDADVQTPEVHQRPVAPFVALALIVALAVAAYIVFVRRPIPATAPAASAAATPQPKPAERALGGEALAIDVPPLDASDPVVRTLVRGLSANPTIAAWLASKELIRSFVVAIANVTEGTTPAPRLKVIAPAGPFDVVERDGQVYIDPRSYHRYRPLADAAASLDAAGVARLYATLKPRLEEAYRELGQAGTFDGAFQRAIVSLLQTPVVSEPIPVRPKGIGYRFADERLERLTAAQKQLLRMGPENERRVKDKLREIAVAVGVSASELPSR